MRAPCLFPCTILPSLLSSMSAPSDSSKGHLRDDAMKLVTLEAQPSQVALAGLAQMLRPAVGMPLVRAAARQATLGGDDEIVRVGARLRRSAAQRPRGRMRPPCRPG